MRTTWRIVGVIGEGGFARVFEAVERDSSGFGRRVALKVLREEPAPPEVLERLRREVQLLRALGGGTFVNAEGPRRIGGRWALVLDLVDGRAVSHLGVVPGRAALEIVAACARAMVAAAARVDADGKALGLVHRDLTLSNVLVTRAGELRIVDLGLGRSADSADLTRDSAVPGSANYVAPERFHGRDGPEADVYALGVGLARMTGTATPSDRTVSRTTVGPVPEARLLALGEAMRADDPTERPTMQEVADRSSVLAASMDGPTLRTLASERVPERVTVTMDHPWVGRVVGEDPPARFAVRGALVVGGVALVLAAAVASRIAAPPLPDAGVTEATRGDDQVGVRRPDERVETGEAQGLRHDAVDTRSEPDPGPKPIVPVPPPPPVPVWVRTRPYGTVTVGGRSWKTEDKTMELPPGPQRLQLETYDHARRHLWRVNVRLGEENSYCWDFDKGEPCSR